MRFAGCISTRLVIPFIGLGFDLGIFYYVFALILLTGMVNAVNLTDGIDGLASSVTLVVACAFMLMTGLLGNISTNVLSAALAGACTAPR